MTREVRDTCAEKAHVCCEDVIEGIRCDTRGKNAIRKKYTLQCECCEKIFSVTSEVYESHSDAWLCSSIPSLECEGIPEEGEDGSEYNPGEDSD